MHDAVFLAFTVARCAFTRRVTGTAGHRVAAHIGVAGYPLAVAVRTSARAVAARAGIVAVLVARKLPVCVRVYRTARGAAARRPRKCTALDIFGLGLEETVVVGFGHGNVENVGVQMNLHTAPILGDGNQRLPGDDVDLRSELPEALLNRIHVIFVLFENEFVAALVGKVGRGLEYEARSERNKNTVVISGQGEPA